MRYSKFRQPESAVDVRLDGAVELLSRNVGDVRTVVLKDKISQRSGFNDSGGVTNHDACIIDEDINPTEILDHGVDDPLTSSLFTDILRDEKCTTTVLHDEFLGLAGVVGFLRQVDDSDLRTQGKPGTISQESANVHLRPP